MLVNTTNKPAPPKAANVKRGKTRNHSRDVKVEEGLNISVKKQKKHRKPPSTTQDVDTSSSMRALQAGVAGIDFLDGSDGVHVMPSLDGSDGMHVLPSESLDSLVSPAMRIALGLDVLTTTDSEPGSSGDDDDIQRREDEKAESDSTERQHHAGKKGGTTTTTLEEDTTGVDQGKNFGKPSNMCFASQGWGQPNSLIVSGGCDKVVRVWDVQSG